MEKADERIMIAKKLIEEILDQSLLDDGIDSFDEMDSLSRLTTIMDLEDALDISIPINDVDTITCRDEFVSKVIVMSGLSGSAA